MAKILHTSIFGCAKQRISAYMLLLFLEKMPYNKILNLLNSNVESSREMSNFGLDALPLLSLGQYSKTSV